MNEATLLRAYGLSPDAFVSTPEEPPEPPTEADTPAEPGTCGAWMPIALERCARAPGHSGTVRYPDHRTRYAMECAARARRGGRPA